MDYVRMKSAANANLQNAINTSIILHYIRNEGAVYRSEISRALNLSLPAVSRAVRHLIDKGFLTEKRIVTESGRKAHEPDLAARASFEADMGTLSVTAGGGDRKPW